MEQYIPYIIDGLLILFLIIRFVRGYNKGFVREILSLAINIGSLVVLVLYLNPARDFLVKYIDISKWITTKNIWVNYLISLSKYAVVTLVVFVVLSLVAKLLTIWVKKVVQRCRDDHPSFAGFDKFFGFIFGLVNGLVTLVILCYLAFQPIFIPKGQEYLEKTQFATAVYEVTEDTLEKVVKKDKDEINSLILSYLAGAELNQSEEDEFKTKCIAQLIADFPVLISNPSSLLSATGEQSGVVLIFVNRLSALADLTSRVPEDPKLNERFGIIYNELVALLPDDVIIHIDSAQYDVMFDAEKGTFYSVGLSQDQINVVQNKFVRTVVE